MSWKSYYSVQPCQSKILQAKWDEQNYNKHVQKLAQIQPQIDTRAPKTYIHMHLKLNKIRMEEERLYVIERDNRVLLEKMSHTMRTKGRIDNVNKYTLKSLNKLNRQQELLKITKENRSLMERILRRKPEYDRSEWEKDWKKNVDCMENLTNYPREFRNEFKKFTQSKPQKKKKTRVGTSFTQLSRYNNHFDNNETQMGVDNANDLEDNATETTEKKQSDQDDNTDSNRTATEKDVTQEPSPKSLNESETNKITDNEQKETKDTAQDYESDFDEEEAAPKNFEKESTEKAVENDKDISNENKENEGMSTLDKTENVQSDNPEKTDQPSENDAENKESQNEEVLHIEEKEAKQKNTSDNPADIVESASVDKSKQEDDGIEEIQIKD